MNEQELDQLLNEMRQEEAPAQMLAAAQERVWNQLSAGPACLAFRAQFDDYRAGRLAASHAMLLEDHLSRCAGCRRAMQPVETTNTVVAMPARTRRFAVPRWAIAAGVAAVSLYLGRNVLDQALAPSGPRATVEASTGTVYALNAATLANGAAVGDGEVVRTAAGARTHLRLADGSVVEVNERTELSVKAAWSGSTIFLERGDIIVRAAKQRRGYLKVVTRDSEAAVKGTIFTVSAGTAGSLVGVVEGSVAVTQPGTERLLKPGERAATSPALGKVTVREAVAWSEEKEKHFALLTELAAIEKKLPAREARTSTRLLKMLPPDVRVYAAIPNLGPTMGAAMDMLEQRSRDNAVLEEWWNSAGAGQVKTIVDRLRQLSPLMGEEIVFAMAGRDMPLILTEAKPGLEAELAKVLPAGVGFRVVNGVAVIAKAPEQIVGLLGQGADTPFAQEIAARYARGVSWLLGVDAALAGTKNVKFAFIEQRAVQGVEENEATVTFDGPRKGVASWLAGPGSAGSAEYATADAVAVFSAATRNPKQIFDELSGMAPGFADRLREVEAKTGINVGNDLAAALGTDFTLSLETAAIPIPGWVAAIEVYQPATLNAAIARIAEAYNREAGERPKLVLKQETADGREWRSLTLNGFGLQWTFDRGYWIVSMDRATAMRALATRAGGLPLVRSEAFRSRMPTLAGVHPSGFAWLNPGGAAEVLSNFVSSPQLKRFLAVREASLLTFNGETERIQAASRTRLTSVLLEALAGMHPKQ